MRPHSLRNWPKDSLQHPKDGSPSLKDRVLSIRPPVYTSGVSGDQPRFLITAVFAFPWDRVFDQGERVFEVVLLVLWFAFVAFLAFSAIRFVREKAKNKSKGKRKRRDRSASPARGCR
jgi:hypothetical protein